MMRLLPQKWKPKEMHKSAMPDNYSILLVGAGNMGAAMLQGWLQAGIAPSRISVQDPHLSSKAAELIAQYKIATGLHKADVVVLATKPQMMLQVLPTLKPYVNEKTLVLSIAAGIAVKTYEAHLGAVPIVRTMPNLPAAYGAGLTGAFANAQANADSLYTIRATELLNSSGLVMWLADELSIDGVTAVSGSGPGYVFALVEAFEAAAIELGFAQGEAKLMARQTFIGAACMLAAEPDTSAAQFRARVTSPAGTTEAGLKVLMRNDELNTLMKETVVAAFVRAQELGV